MIERIQTGAKDAVDAMQQSRERAKHSVSQAADAGNSLEAIDSAVSNINTMNSQIAGASEEQLSSARSVSENMGNIRELTEQSVLSANQVTASGEELSRLAGKMNAMISEYRT